MIKFPNASIVLTILIVFSTFSQGEGFDGGSPEIIRPPDYSVSENYFYEHYLMSNSITDLGISLEENWTNSDVKRLSELLKQLNSTRPTRQVDMSEWTYATVLVFKTGDQFNYSVATQEYENPAAIWGGGLSGKIYHRFQIPMAATDDEIKAMIGPHLPEILQRDPNRLERWQNSVARAKGARGLCARVLGQF